MTPPSRRAPRTISIPSLAVAAVVVLPLAYLVLRSLASGDALWSALMSPATWRLTGRTLSLVAGTLVVSNLLAVGTAWLVVRTDVPGRRFWALMGAVPLVFPSYVAAFSWVAVLGPRGYLASVLGGFGVESLPPFAYGYTGALAVLSLFTYPYSFLLVTAALRDLDPALEESSRSLGVGRVATFAQVVLPQLRPAMAAGSLLVVLYALSDFGAVSIVRYNTFTLSIYNAYRALFDRSTAAVLALLLIALTAVFLGLERRVRGRAVATRRGSATPAPRRPLGRWRWPAFLGLAAVGILNVGIPVGVVTFWGARALRVGNPLGSVAEVALNSFMVSAAAAVVTLAASLPLAVWGVRYPGRGSDWASRVAHAGYALPGLVVALAWVFFAARYAPWLYQTLGLLILAYAVRFLPEALAATRTAVGRVDESLEEAAQSLGDGPYRRLGSLVIPMVRPGVLAGAGLVFLTAMKELPATLLLRPTGFDTLATRIWGAASEGVYSQAALPSLALVLVSALPVYWLIVRPTVTGRESGWTP